MSPVRAALRNLFSLCRPYRALIRMFQIPGAYAPGYFLVQTGRITDTLDRAHGIHL